ALPEVDHVMTLPDLIPADQPAKLAMIGEAAKALDAVWRAPLRPAPTDDDNIAALKVRITDLNQTAEGQTGPGADAARRLAAALSKLAAAGQQARQRVEAAFIVPIRKDIETLRSFLQAQQITLDN